MRLMVVNFSRALDQDLVDQDPPDQHAPFHAFDPTLYYLPRHLQKKMFSPTRKKTKAFGAFIRGNDFKPLCGPLGLVRPPLSPPKNWAHYARWPTLLRPLALSLRAR